jgi:hypothetical protein
VEIHNQKMIALSSCISIAETNHMRALDERVYGTSTALFEASLAQTALRSSSPDTKHCYGYGVLAVEKMAG